MDAGTKIRPERLCHGNARRIQSDSGARQAAEHVKKQEHPQTHEEREVKTLVDRIEKKVSDQQLATPVRVCTFCNRQFKVPLESMKRVGDAQ